MTRQRDYMVRESQRVLEEYKKGQVTKRQAVYELYATGYGTDDAINELNNATKGTGTPC